VENTRRLKRGQRIMPRPFLKWVGGKSQLLPELIAAVDRADGFNRYHEPFVGGGALFFELYRKNRLRKQAWLSDNNPRLIEAYQGVKDDVEKLIALLEKHKARHSHDYYYEMRANVPKSSVERAARIVYLNKTCYNGLFRENSKGIFNTPIGTYTNPQICDEENLRAVSAALAKAKIEQRHFEAVLEKAKPGDLVYFDPPYHPVSKTASFTAYAQGGFGEDSQRLLARTFADLAGRGVKVLLSNSMTDLIAELYTDFTIEVVQATRNVNSKAGRRGKIEEALISNF
jgi:DNA adenine methylase